MKIIKTLILATALCPLFQSCNDGDSPKPAEMIDVQFSGSLNTSESNGKILSGEEPTHLIISVVSLAGGEPLLNMEKIDLYKIGSSYVAKPVALPSGTHKITDFLLVTESNEVVYAVPKYGSTLEKAVSKPLPHQFYVGKDAVFQHSMEVLNTSAYEANDLGYASFPSQIVNPLRMAVFTSDNPSLPTDAHVTVLQEGNIIEQVSLQPQINLISFPGGNNENYTIEVKKEGYATYVRDFNYSQLIDSLDNMLLEIELKKSFTMLAYIDFAASDIFSMSLQGDSGLLFIDFGDGTSTDHALTTSSSTSEIRHTYATEGNHPITITGDIHMIKEFYSYYGDGMILEIDFTGLTGLESIIFGLTRGPAVVDLSRCEKLRSVNMAAIPQLEDLILPDVNFINYFLISGSTSLNTDDIDDIINKIHENAVLNNEMNGDFLYGTDWVADSGDPIGPPSASSIAKLTELRDSYGWTVLPPL